MSRFSDSTYSKVHDRVYGLLSIADKREIFEIDYAISTAELFMRTLRIAPPPGSSSLADLEYISVLVNSLQIFDSDLREEKPCILQENNAPDS